MRKMPQGILNPMYAKADFNLPQHPYQNFYVAPNQQSLEQNQAASHGGLNSFGLQGSHGLQSMEERPQGVAPWPNQGPYYNL